MTADKFRAAAEKLAEDTARLAGRIANRRNITRDQKAVRIAALLNNADAAATALADGWTSRQLETLTGQATPAKGVLPTDHSERLLKSANTVLADGIDLDRVERLARSEVMSTAQSAATEAMTGRKVRGGYIGWRRMTNPGACDLCVKWAASKRVFPPDVTMARHVSCGCVPEAVISETKPKPIRRKSQT